MRSPPSAACCGACRGGQYSRARDRGAVSSRRSPSPGTRVPSAFAPGHFRGARSGTPVAPCRATDGSCGGGRVKAMKRLSMAGMVVAGAALRPAGAESRADWRGGGRRRHGYDGYGRRLARSGAGVPLRLRPRLARGLGGGPPRRPRAPRPALLARGRVPGRRPRLQALDGPALGLHGRLPRRLRGGLPARVRVVPPGWRGRDGWDATVRRSTTPRAERYGTARADGKRASRRRGCQQRRDHA